jgi:phospholipase C
LPVEHVVIAVQENHTTDNYFRALTPQPRLTPQAG